MDVIFNGEDFPRQERAELEDVLQRIAIGDKAGCWRESPDTILVRGRLTDGRSGCEVLEIVVRTGAHEAPMVAKVGPFHELEGEWTAFTSHLSGANAFFAPIRAATPAVLGTSPPADGEREAVVYDHAARFAGQPEHSPRRAAGGGADRRRRGRQEHGGAGMAVPPGAGDRRPG